MIISGFFHFLHYANVAWLLSARQSAAKNSDILTVNILPDTPETPDQESRKKFLSSFNFADKITTTNSSRSEFPLPATSNSQMAILESWIEPMCNKTIFESSDDLENLFAELHKKNVISTNGCYDILHPGHLATLEYASSLGECLVVMINSDNSVKRFKGDTRPVHDQFFRAAILAQLDYVDYVIVFNDDTPLELMKKIRPSGHVKGGSFIRSRVESEIQLLNSWGGQFHSCPMFGSYSTTKILNDCQLPPFPI